MKLTKLVVKNIWRHPLRTVLTILGMAIAVMAFGVIRSAVDAWYLNAKAASPNLLVTQNAVSLVFPMPISYLEKVRKLPHVTAASHSQWFGGVYVDKQNFFPKFAIEHDTYLPLYPDFDIPPDQLETFKKERNAVIVGRRIADRFGWSIGDPLRIVGDIFPGDWDFVIRGIYTGKKETTDETVLFFQYDYLNERMREEAPVRADKIGTMVIQIDDPSRAAQISSAVDSMFINSMAETKTQTEEAFTLSFLEMSSSIITGLRVISILVIGIILLVLGNTMAMTARERIGEYAVFKTLGFTSSHRSGLIVGESLLIAFLGGAAGIGLTFLIVPLMQQAMADFFPKIPLETLTIILAALATLLVGCLAALFPTLKALRTTIVEGLRTID